MLNGQTVPPNSSDAGRKLIRLERSRFRATAVTKSPWRYYGLRDSAAIQPVSFSRCAGLSFEWMAPMKRRPAIIRHRICRSVQRLAAVTIFTVTLGTAAVGQTAAEPAWNTQVAGARGSPAIWRQAKKMLDKAWDALTNLPLPGSGDDHTQARVEKAKIDRLVKAAEALAQGNVALQREAAEMRLRLDAIEKQLKLRSRSKHG